MGSFGKSTVVYVKWLDHAKSPDDPKGLKPTVRHTLGWLVKETPEYVVLAMDRSKGGREYGFAIVKSLILDSWAASEKHIRGTMSARRSYSNQTLFSTQ